MKAKIDIQRYILTKLLGSKGLRYKEARPLEVPNDLYNYHLQFLVKKGFVEKRREKYILTDLGKYVVVNDKAINVQGKTKDKLSVNVLVLVLRKNKQGKIETINHMRKRHPFFGNKGLSGGGVQKGEPLLKAASRHLYSKMGLRAKFTHVLGCIRLIEMYKNKLFYDIFLFVCATETYTGHLIHENEFGKNEWVTLDKMVFIESKSLTAKRELIRLLSKLKNTPIGEITPFYNEQIKEVYSI